MLRTRVLSPLKSRQRYPGPGPENPTAFRNALATMKTLRAPLGRAHYRENDWISSDPNSRRRADDDFSSYLDLLKDRSNNRIPDKAEPCSGEGFLF